MRKFSLLLLMVFLCNRMFAEGSIKFYGIDSYINLGNQLGLSEYTLEAWIKIQGNGVATSSGNGGVNAVPIICKGRGEEDANNKDCNYFFGYDPGTMKLVADFEEGSLGSSPGLNHPVYGTKSLKYNTWQHVAVAYDGRKWYLYLNGELDTTKFINQPVQNQSIQYVSIGSALTSTANPAGFFNGTIDDVRIWNRARTNDEIKILVNKEVTGNEQGLVCCWRLNEGAGSVVNGLGFNSNNGVVVGNKYSWLPENAPFNLPLPPVAKSSPLLFKAGIVADPQYKNAASTDRYYRESLSKLSTAIVTFNTNQVDFVQTLGDVVDEDSISFNPILSIYRNLNVNIPNYHLLGNHDFNVQQQFKSKITTKLGMPGNYYSYNFKGYRFIVLDATDIASYTDDLIPQNSGKDKIERDSLFRVDKVTNKTDYSGALSRVQLAWLKSELNSATLNNQNIVIFNHMPVLPKPNVHNLWNDYEVVNILSNYRNVRAYMNGHNHFGGYEMFKGIHFATIYGMVQGPTNSYAMVDFYENKMIIHGYGNQEDRILEFINDAPTDIELSNDEITQYSRKGDLVGTLNATDLNKYDNHTYSFAVGAGDGDNQLFSIKNDSLLLNTNLIGEAKSYYSIRLKAIDSRNDSVTKPVTIKCQNYQQTGVFNYKNSALNNSGMPDICLFPNPTNGTVTVLAPQPDIISFLIYNKSGQIVYNQKKETLNNSTDFDLKQIPSNVYIVNIKTSNVNYITKFIRK